MMEKVILTFSIKNLCQKFHVLFSRKAVNILESLVLGDTLDLSVYEAQPLRTLCPLYLFF